MSAAGPILVTGSRQGLGRKLAEHYLARGCTVFGFSRSACDLIHRGYRHFSLDVADDKAVRAAFSDIAREGGLRVLINAAGAKTSSHTLLTSAAQANEMIRTNLLGAFVVTRHALQLLKRSRFGRVISLSSIAVPLGSVGSVVYGATKAGLEQMAHAMSREFANDDITFNTVGISVFPDSAMVRALSPEVLAETRRALIKPSDLTVEEIAAAIDFFASPAARNITNQTVYFGGLR